MKEYEVHSFVTYISEGGTQEYDCYLDYVEASTKAEAKKAIRAQYKAMGVKVISMEANVA